MFSWNTAEDTFWHSTNVFPEVSCLYKRGGKLHEEKDKETIDYIFNRVASGCILTDYRCRAISEDDKGYSGECPYMGRFQKTGFSGFP